MLNAVTNICSPYPCPAEQFQDTDLACRACPPNCDYCSDAATCEICSDTYYLLASSCVSSCPTGRYIGHSANANTELIGACVSKIPLAILLQEQDQDASLIKFTTSHEVKNIHLYMKESVNISINGNPNIVKTLDVEMVTELEGIMAFQYKDSFPSGSTLDATLGFFVDDADASTAFALTSSTLSISVSEYVAIPKAVESLMNISAQQSSIGGKFMIFSFLLKNLNEIGSSIQLRIVQMFELMQFARYVNVKYPANIQNLFKSSPSSPISFSFVPNIPEMIINAVASAYDEAKLAHGVFGEYGLPPYFLANYGDNISTITTMFLFGMTIELLLLAKNKMHWRLKLVLQRLSQLFRWNFLLTLLVSDLLSISYYALMDFINNDVSNGYEIMSLVIAIFFSLFLIIVPYGVIRLSRELTKYGKDDVPLRFQKYEVLFGDYRFETKLQRFFVTILAARAVFFSVVIIFLQPSALAQILLLFLSNLAIFVYMIVVRPFESKKEAFQQGLNELIVMLFNGCGVFFACAELAGYKNAKVNSGLGLTMIILNTLMMSVNLILVTYDLISALIDIVKALVLFMKAKSEDDFNVAISEQRGGKEFGDKSKTKGETMGEEGGDTPPFRIDRTETGEYLNLKSRSISSSDSQRRQDTNLNTVSTLNQTSNSSLVAFSSFCDRKASSTYWCGSYS